MWAANVQSDFQQPYLAQCLKVFSSRCFANIQSNFQQLLVTRSGPSRV